MYGTTCIFENNFSMTVVIISAQNHLLLIFVPDWSWCMRVLVIAQCEHLVTKWHILAPATSESEITNMMWHVNGYSLVSSSKDLVMSFRSSTKFHMPASQSYNNLYLIVSNSFFTCKYATTKQMRACIYVNVGVLCLYVYSFIFVWVLIYEKYTSIFWNWDEKNSIIIIIENVYWRLC